eukprot:3591926-Heterocapsa_arctica.AAC.1
MPGGQRAQYHRVSRSHHQGVLCLDPPAGAPQSFSLRLQPQSNRSIWTRHRCQGTLPAAGHKAAQAKCLGVRNG